MHPESLKKNKLAHLIAMAITFGGGLTPLVGFAYDAKVGNYDFSLNSTVSVGTAFRVEGQDRALIGASNTTEDGVRGTSASSTTDDGNLNFNKGERFTTTFKGVHDFELEGSDHGFFARVKWFYDETLNEKEVFHGHSANGYATKAQLEDSGFHPYSRFDGIDLLDAFGYYNTEVNGMPLDIRLGKQVISWGESTLIFSPITGLNTLDLSALRRPGVDLKEAFIPAESLSFNLGLTDDTSLEAFYQLKWRKTVTEGCGTYFASNDIVGDGCNVVTLTTNPLAGNAATTDSQSANGVNNVRRSQDVQPDDDGQYGLALRKYVGKLDTEFGFYYLNYHSRLPIVSARKGAGVSVVPFFNGHSYVMEYPEDISIFGLSAATNLGGWAVSGEISHAKDVPIQINTFDILAGTLNGNAGNGGLTNFGARFLNASAGDIVSGFDRFDVTQVQSTVIKTFDRMLGSNTIVFVGEVGMNFVSNLPDAGTAPSSLRYGRSPVFGLGSAAIGGTNIGDGFVTDFSWGYRARVRGVYRNVFGNTDLIPSVSWSHDVEGYSPEPGQAFQENRRSLGLGMGFELDANTRIDINYVNFADSAGYNVFRDRDFASINASFSF